MGEFIFLMNVEDEADSVQLEFEDRMSKKNIREYMLYI